jgi:hypothetical protein
MKGINNWHMKEKIGPEKVVEKLEVKLVKQED